MKLNEYIQNKSLISFVSDVEGNYTFWLRFIENSKVLYRNVENNQIELRDHCYFIHGGDVNDRGNGDIRIAKDLVSLKRRYPNRVFFLHGNRDFTKLRYPSIFHPKVLKERPDVFWRDKSAVPRGLKYWDPVERMKWEIKIAMVCPFGFEARRMELQEMGLPSEDQDVVNSYLDQVKEGNDFMEYLRLAQVGVIIEDILFIHGALDSDHIGFIPPRRDYLTGKMIFHPYPNKLTPYEWVDQMNAFAEYEIDQYLKYNDHFIKSLDDLSFEEIKEQLWDYCGHYSCPQPAARLMQCGLNFFADLRPCYTVMYSSFLQNGIPQPFQQPVVDWLASSGIKKLIVGHAPHGDCPFIMDYLGFQVIISDSSYSRSVDWMKTDHQRIYQLSSNSSSSWIDEKIQETRQQQLQNTFDSLPNWINAMEFEEKVQHPIVFPSSSSTLQSIQPTRIFDEQMKDIITRNQYCIHEVLLVFPTTIEENRFFIHEEADNDNNNNNDNNNDYNNSNKKRKRSIDLSTIMRSEMICHGLLGNGLPYCYLLKGYSPALTSSTAQEVQEEEVRRVERENDFLGKRTRDGWYVKANKLKISPAELADGLEVVVGKEEEGSDRGGGGGGDQGWYYLLCHSVGFDFKNRIVSRDELLSLL